MKFTGGQIAFIILFVAVFIGAQIWSYAKDKSSNRKHYSGSWKVLVALILFLTVLFLIVRSAQSR